MALASLEASGSLQQVYIHALLLGSMPAPGTVHSTSQTIMRIIRILLEQYWLY